MSESAGEKLPDRGRSWVRRVVGVLVVLAIVGLVAGELYARFHLGLGDPPLTRADADTEYISVADQNCHRFGNFIHFNHYSMRSDDFPEHKSKPAELRVMVIGDSIINGGAQTDQSQIATQLLQAQLASDLKRPVVVGNISAGGRGPPNELGYLKKYGLFDADVLVIVLNSADYADAHLSWKFTGVDKSFPTHKPPLALWDGFDRYLVPRLGWGQASNEGTPAVAATVSQAAIDRSMAALHDMIEVGRQAGARVIVAQFIVDAETAGTYLPGHPVIAEEVRRDGLEPLDLLGGFADGKRRGEQLYRDGVHPNAAGQVVLSQMLRPAVEEALREGPSTHPSSTQPVAANEPATGSATSVRNVMKR